MTGYGKASDENETIKVVVEIRTLNSKYLDVGIKLPKSFTEKEIELKKIIGDKLERGKVSVTIDYQKKFEIPNTSINTGLFKQYYFQFMALAEEVGASAEEIFKISLQAPDVMVSETIEEFAKEDWEVIKGTFSKALSHCDQFRVKEGEVLQSNLAADIKNIETYLKQVDLQDPNRITAVRERLNKQFNELQNSDRLDENRLEQELIYYIEKLDINEEKVRLKSHLNYFTEVLASDNSQGKKLGFIAQEIGREINTIGSKANDAIIQKYVVGMKEELEKIKEQLLNVV